MHSKELKEMIYGILNTTGYKIYLNYAKQSDTMPYIIYKMPDITQIQQNKDEITLEINIWNTRGSTPTTETIFDTLDLLLNHKTHKKLDKVFAHSYRIHIIDDLPTEDENIKHCEIRYLFKNYSIH